MIFKPATYTRTFGAIPAFTYQHLFTVHGGWGSGSYEEAIKNGIKLCLKIKLYQQLYIPVPTLMMQ
jgi:hypothetical protein